MNTTTTRVPIVKGRARRPTLPTEVGEPLGRGRLQTDHAQRWNEGRWGPRGGPSGFIQKPNNSKRHFLEICHLSLRYSSELNSCLQRKPLTHKECPEAYFALPLNRWVSSPAGTPCISFGEEHPTPFSYVRDVGDHRGGVGSCVKRREGSRSTM